jgi:hypothetical protein
MYFLLTGYFQPRSHMCTLCEQCFARTVAWRNSVLLSVDGTSRHSSVPLSRRPQCLIDSYLQLSQIHLLNAIIFQTFCLDSMSRLQIDCPWARHQTSTAEASPDRISCIIWNSLPLLSLHEHKMSLSFALLQTR